MDDVFTRSVRRVRLICEGMLGRGMDFGWWCSSRVDAMADTHDMPALMARAKAGSMSVAVESVGAKTLASFCFRSRKSVHRLYRVIVGRMR